MKEINWWGQSTLSICVSLVFNQKCTAFVVSIETHAARWLLIFEFVARQRASTRCLPHQLAELAPLKEVLLEALATHITAKRAADVASCVVGALWSVKGGKQKLLGRWLIAEYGKELQPCGSTRSVRVLPVGDAPNTSSLASDLCLDSFGYAPRNETLVTQHSLINLNTQSDFLSQRFGRLKIESSSIKICLQCMWISLF